MSQPLVSASRIIKFDEGTFSETSDLLAAEVPLEIRLGYGKKNNRQQKSIAVTMRTPGHDFELAIGFLFTEGIITSYEDVLLIKYCRDKEQDVFSENILRVELREEVLPDLEKLKRNFYTSSSCGICGKASIEAIKTIVKPAPTLFSIKLSSKTILQLPLKLRNHQHVFEHTGGLHASAFFDLEGNLNLLREDVGRHNALDKLIGASLITKGKTSEVNNNLSNQILLLSGRASFELIQKGAMAGIQLICVIGAPSSLSVETAEAFNITLIGFLRNNRFNLYTHSYRIT